VPVTVVVGAQYGGEGKGKVVAHLALAERAEFVVRCGGPNSGHTVELNGLKYELKQVPAGFVNSRTRLLLAAGAVIQPSLLLEEIAACGLTPERIGVDINAAVLESFDPQRESELLLRDRFGSTGVGMGSAVARRVIRARDVRRAVDVPELKPYLTSVQAELRSALIQDAKIVVEGTQGFGLSLYHTEQWPYCTSRDTTAGSFLGEVGLGPRGVQVIMAVRTFPIRVGGNSGPLANELSWSDVQKRSGYPHAIAEYTTTTKRLRRVGAFDPEVVLRAVTANTPTYLALHGVDYLDYKNRGGRSVEELSSSAHDFMRELETLTKTRVGLIGTGPSLPDLIDIRTDARPETLQWLAASGMY
jgi:adenylosuccinate synthase